MDSVSVNPVVESPAAPAPPEAAGPSSKLQKALVITSAAASYAREKLAARGTPEAAVRLGIRGGGCSGFSYVIEFSDDPAREKDIIYEVDGIRFYVDKKSLVYLAGSMLDYERTLMFQGFKFKNPNEASRCGCGHSFTVR